MDFVYLCLDTDFRYTSSTDLSVYTRPVHQTAHYFIQDLISSFWKTEWNNLQQRQLQKSSLEVPSWKAAWLLLFGTSLGKCFYFPICSLNVGFFVPLVPCPGCSFVLGVRYWHFSLVSVPFLHWLQKQCPSLSTSYALLKKSPFCCFCKMLDTGSWKTTLVVVLFCL